MTRDHENCVSRNGPQGHCEEWCGDESCETNWLAVEKAAHDVTKALLERERAEHALTRERLERERHNLTKAQWQCDQLNALLGRGLP